MALSLDLKLLVASLGLSFIVSAQCPELVVKSAGLKLSSNGSLYTLDLMVQNNSAQKAESVEVKGSFLDPQGLAKPLPATYVIYDIGSKKTKRKTFLSGVPESDRAAAEVKGSVIKALFLDGSVCGDH